MATALKGSACTCKPENVTLSQVRADKEAEEVEGKVADKRVLNANF